MKKSINDRCPLQVECERKKCDFIRKELECPYYSANAREGYYIDDQEEARERQYREHMDETLLASLGDDDDDDAAGGGLVYIPIEQLYPHPDNPRKDLGDLTELADNWLSQDEENPRNPKTDPITEEELARRISMTSLSVTSGGSFTAWFDCDEMFTDHAVTVYGSLKKGLKTANIEG